VLEQSGNRSGNRGDKASDASCEQLVLERAFGDLAEAAERDTRMGSVAAPLHDRLRELATRVSPRTEHGLIHGELGPDHVLRLLDGDFPHRTLMQEIADHNAKEALALLVHERRASHIELAKPSADQQESG
jgi:hypothetical protein